MILAALMLAPYLIVSAAGVSTAPNADKGTPAVSVGNEFSAAFLGEAIQSRPTSSRLLSSSAIAVEAARTGQPLAQ